MVSVLNREPKEPEGGEPRIVFALQVQVSVFAFSHRGDSLVRAEYKFVHGGRPVEKESQLQRKSDSKQVSSTDCKTY